MNKLMTLIGATAGSTVGWWAGSRVGIMTAFLSSIVGTAAGVYFGARVARAYFS